MVARRREKSFKRAGDTCHAILRGAAASPASRPYIHTGRRLVTDPGIRCTTNRHPQHLYLLSRSEAVATALQNVFRLVI